MTKSELITLINKLATQYFGKNLSFVGISGSFYELQDGVALEIGDLDLIIVLRKYTFHKSQDFIEQLEKQTTLKSGVIIMTEMMIDNRKFWCSKFIVMAYKGIKFIKNNDITDFKIDFETASALSKPLMSENTYHIQKAIQSGKIDVDRGYDLLIQQLVLCS
jgi:hypothetical protein